MKSNLYLVFRNVVLVLAPMMLVHQASAAKKASCAAPDPAQQCTPTITCGSASNPCVVDVKRGAGKWANSKPDLPEAKDNALFCIQAGTKVTWKSSRKNTGFVVDFGETSPFVPEGAIIGGSNREVEVEAKKPGCYKYSVGACISGTVSGMCGSSPAELVILGPK